MIRGIVEYNGYSFRVENNGRQAQVFIWYDRPAYHRIDASEVMVGCVILRDGEFEQYIAALGLAELVYKDMVG